MATVKKAKTTKRASAKRTPSKQSKSRVSARSVSTTKAWKVEPVAPPKLSVSTWQAANVLAALLAIMVVLQLANFNDVATGLQDLGMPKNAGWAGFLVFAEILSIASLMRLPLSRLFRRVSAWSLVVVSSFWFILSVTAAVNSKVSNNIFIFGTSAPLADNALAVIFAGAFLGASLYIANLVQGD